MLSYYVRFIMKSINWFFGILFVIPSLFSRMKRKKKIPPISNPILLKSATQLAIMIRTKEVKSEEIIQAYIARINEVNPILNAVVQARFTLALGEAQDADRLIASEKYTIEELEYHYPILGIPVTIKESISVKGMSNKAGRLNSHVEVAKEDSEAISQLRAAGGIPIAVTNTPELCMCTETFNYVTGRTNNPYDTRKTSGGSSGGEAALISSGASVIGVGSDIAGSLRIPAMCCGVFAHKPTERVVSTVGHVPQCDTEEWKRLFTFGPMVRYAEDLTLLMNVLKDPKKQIIDLEQPVALKELKFYYMDGDNSGATDGINADIKEALKKVITHFDNTYRIEVKKVKLKYMEYGFETSILSLLKIDGVDTIFSKPDNFKEWRPVWPEVFKKIFGCSNSLMTSIGYGILKKIGRCIPESYYAKVSIMNTKIRKEFMDLLQLDGVFFYPTLPYTANFHGGYVRRLLNLPYTLLFSSLGFPTSHCPLGLSAGGMPVGIQVVTSPGQDHLNIAVCKELERAFGGWVPPSY